MSSLLLNQKSNYKTFFAPIRKKSDTIMDIAMAGYFLVAIFLSSFYDTWFLGVGTGLLCLLAYYSAKLILPDSTFYQYVAGSVYAIFMALFIYQMHGMFEMHFWAYVAATLLITYQNWKLYIPLSILILVHHAGFAWLQFSGLEEVYFTQLEYMNLQTFLFHAALAVLIIAICAYWSYDLSLRTIEGGLMQQKLEKQLKNVDSNIRFAEEISKGNLETEFAITVKDDELGQALINMQQSLVKAHEREKQEKFISNGIARLSDILRLNMNDMKELSDKVLQEVVKYLQLNQAGLFLLEEEDTGRPVLELQACYAYNRKKYQNKKIEIGEGLVGQAYLEKEYIYMTDVPQGYTYITSGLGDATPASILILPLLNNQEVVGILEVASLKEIPQTHIEFLLKAAEGIASTILSARINYKTNQLLLQAQEQAETLRAQEEEMRQNLEEMEATQEEIQRIAQEYGRNIMEKEQEIEELRQQLKVLELNS